MPFFPQVDSRLRGNDSESLIPATHFVIPAEAGIHPIYRPVATMKIAMRRLRGR
jgi:hypothetical protein